MLNHRVKFPRLNERDGNEATLAFNNEPADTAKLKTVDRVELLIKGYERLKEETEIVIRDKEFARLRGTL
jgi:hypothetical protein